MNDFKITVKKNDKKVGSTTNWNEVKDYIDEPSSNVKGYEIKIEPL